ncbi:trace amine-associated receptor 13c-like [Protopterus annectens]|uniref:trace amine-associated receptor 13c-like n=1 Tax=Protopterus annectens TaxID=7888 RepID=UPI001CFBE049|nr:trace amine-associated receptor 13c-like [Protopterus annectens]
MDVNVSLDLTDHQYCFIAISKSCIKEYRSSATKICLYVIFSLGLTLTLCGNGVVILSISYFKQLHTPTNFLVLSLAVADFLIGLVVMPFSMIRTIETCWFFGESFCLFHSSLDISLTTISVFHLMFIAVDRYYAICQPLFYPFRITNHIILVFITISWILPVAYSYGIIYTKFGILESYVSALSCQGQCVLIINALWSPVHALFSFFIPCLVMLGMYAKILFVAKKHAKVIHSTEQNHSLKENRKHYQKRESKATKTLAIVMGVFIFCWLPVFVDVIADPYMNFITPTVVYDAMVWLGYFNSTFNPLIYAFFYPWFQKALQCILTCRILGHASATRNLITEHN